MGRANTKTVRFGDAEIRDLERLHRGSMCPFFEGGKDGVDGGQLNPMTADDDWARFPEPLVVDSGASATVLPAKWFHNYKKRESEGSKQGEWWRAANNTKIYNEGERTLQWLASMDP